jgi:hypothetical protein
LAPLSLLSLLGTLSTLSTLSALRKRPASGDAAARIFLHQLVDFDLSFSAISYRIFLIFDSKKSSYLSL